MLAGVTEVLRYSLLIRLVHSQCYYSWQLCVDGFPPKFYGVFQVLAGVTEVLRYSLLMLVLWPQCYYSWQPVGSFSPSALRHISTAHWCD